MATKPVQIDTNFVTEGERLYAASRRKRAEWDLASYADDALPHGPPDDVQDAHCDETADALNAYLLHPAEDLRALAIKLRVFRDEDIFDNWCRGREIVAVIAEDAHRLAFGRD